MNKLVENLDYIKQQTNQLLGELREIKRKVPSKQEFQQINYLLEGNTEEVTGFTTYTGISKADKTYPILFNFIISLLLQIIEKLNKLLSISEKPQPSTTTIDNDLDKIISGINKLSLGEEVKIRRKPIPYTHWVPRK